ncbi:MAG: winged helix-turn-helix domain-containing protein [Candidatus Thermoplasmatota archaeon]|jgi:DNA-binding transcriptional ArsR family regulator|nr:winged helix-turn-helix domain-containing protein [Candidatus Thermoplasmatota archaeon]MCL6002199.1 winged helix-turn-helix domain-containing protein [Candidatus Thermoplasmatota archaeon]
MFELQVKLKNPSVGNDIDRLLSEFLFDIGYLEERGEFSLEAVRESVPFKMFKEVFLMRADKTWPVNELMTYLGTTKPTLYRHLNRLKGLEIIQEVQLGKEKGYVMRYNSLSLAWNFVESNVKMAMDNYRKRIESIQAMVE